MFVDAVTRADKSSARKKKRRTPSLISSRGDPDRFILDKIITDCPALASPRGLASPRLGTAPALASPRAGGGGASRGDDTCVAPAALKAVLVSIKIGGLTAAERAKIKANKKLAAKEEEERKAKEGMSAEVT